MPILITYNKLKADMNEANLKEEFNPSDWPLDENEINWLVKYINNLKDPWLEHFKKRVLELIEDKVMNEQKIEQIKELLNL